MNRQEMFILVRNTMVKKKYYNPNHLIRAIDIACSFKYAVVVVTLVPKDYDIYFNFIVLWHLPQLIVL